MDPDSIKQIAAIIILIILSGFFSMSETALMSVGKLKIRQMLDSGVKGAERLSKLKQNPDKFLASILIANNLVNISAAAIATVLAASFSQNNFTAIATGIMTALILIFGEITPKTLAQQRAEEIALFAAPLISVLQLLFTPLIIALNFISFIILRILGISPPPKENLITDEVIKTILDVGHEEGVLEHDERQMINNVVDFGDYEAKDIMTPRTKIVAADVTGSYDEIMQLFREERFSRLPVYEENIDNIIGVLFIKDLIFSEQSPQDFDIQALLREVYYTYESKTSIELFSIMKSKRYSMTVVLDEYGGTSGIITLEDLVEEIVGELTDEDDEEDDIELIKDDEYIIEGSTRLDEVNEMVGTNLESQSFDSIGGYVIETLGRFPEQGEEVISDGIVFVIEEVDKNRIEKVRLKTQSAAPKEESGL